MRTRGGVFSGVTARRVEGESLSTEPLRPRFSTQSRFTNELNETNNRAIGSGEFRTPTEQNLGQAAAKMNC